MKKIWKFMRTNTRFKRLILIAAFVFPVLSIVFFVKSVPVYTFRSLWIAFYSCLLVCICYETKGLKIFVCCMNAVFVAAFILFFLMGGAEIIPGSLWQMVLPFITNPWKIC